MSAKLLVGPYNFDRFNVEPRRSRWDTADDVYRIDRGNTGEWLADFQFTIRARDGFETGRFFGHLWVTREGRFNARTLTHLLDVLTRIVNDTSREQLLPLAAAVIRIEQAFVGNLPMGLRFLRSNYSVADLAAVPLLLEGGCSPTNVAETGANAVARARLLLGGED